MMYYKFNVYVIILPGCIPLHISNPGLFTEYTYNFYTHCRHQRCSDLLLVYHYSNLLNVSFDSFSVYLKNPDIYTCITIQEKITEYVFSMFTAI